MNVEHRTSNVERPILLALRFIYFKICDSHNIESTKANNYRTEEFRSVFSLVQRRCLRRVSRNLNEKVMVVLD